MNGPEIRVPGVPYKPGDPCAVGRYLLGPYVNGQCDEPAVALLQIHMTLADGGVAELGVCATHFMSMDATFAMEKRGWHRPAEGER